MYKFSDLVQRTILRLSQVTGTSVQIYAEDIVAEMVQHKFDNLFETRWWEDYNYWTSSNLTESGVVSADLSDSAGAGIDRYTDIRQIFYNNDARPLPRVQHHVNPQAFAQRRGRPMLHEPWGEAGKFFRVLPYGDTQMVHINYRKRPDPFLADDMVQMDDHLLILGAAYDYLEDDGSNPGATAKFLSMYNTRYDLVMGSVNEQRIPLGSSYYGQTEPWGNGDHSA